MYLKITTGALIFHLAEPVGKLLSTFSIYGEQGVQKEIEIRRQGMNNFLQDSWVQFGMEISGEFSLFVEPLLVHSNKTSKPEEIDYFCFSITLWAAKIKFKFNKQYKNDYEDRVQIYLRKLKDCFEMEEEQSAYKLEYRVFINRKDMYFDLFESGTSSILKMFSGNTYLPSVERFIEHAFLESTAVKRHYGKVLSKWTFEKAFDFDQSISFY